MMMKYSFAACGAAANALMSGVPANAPNPAAPRTFKNVRRLVIVGS
jgi:hypothetical protein